jgi:hypothetical protein
VVEILLASFSTIAQDQSLSQATACPDAAFRARDSTTPGVRPGVIIATLIYLAVVPAAGTTTTVGPMTRAWLLEAAGYDNRDGLLVRDQGGNPTYYGAIGADDGVIVLGRDEAAVRRALDGNQGGGATASSAAG